MGTAEQPQGKDVGDSRVEMAGQDIGYRTACQQIVGRMTEQVAVERAAYLPARLTLQAEKLGGALEW
jgi:hypothetical protein